MSDVECGPAAQFGGAACPIDGGATSPQAGSNPTAADLIDGAGGQQNAETDGFSMRNVLLLVAVSIGVIVFVTQSKG